MTSLIDKTNIHKYTLVCLDKLGVISYYYSLSSEKVFASYLATSIENVSFESDDFVIAVPVDMVDCMNLLKDNQEARLELLISLANTYRGIKPHDLSMLVTQS